MQPFTLRACVAVLLAGTTGTICAQNKLYDHYGQAAKNLAGASVNAAGDVDQDGFFDYVVGSPGMGIESPGRARVYSGVSGRLIFEIAGDGQNTFRLGQRVAPAWDTNADGHDDLIVVSDNMLAIHSGLDGELLWRIVSFEPQMGFAEAIGVGDINGDRYEDVLVGVSQLEVNVDLDLITLDSEGPGYATLYSGIDGSVLMSFTGDQHGDGFGGTVALTGDLDGNGIRDFAIGCYNAEFPAAGAGYLRAYSGVDGSVMWQLQNAEEGFGYVADTMGDVDGDGLPDLVVGAPQLGWVHFVRGADGTIIRTSRAHDPKDDFGTAVSGIGDVDGDGVPDALVGAPQPTQQTMFGYEILAGPGYAQILSGQTADAIATFYGLATGDEFGRSLRGLGDANGDGRPDLIVGAAQNAKTGINAGMSRVLSANALTLFTDIHELSMAEGGVQLLELQMGLEYAGHLALRLGSMTGIAPAGSFGGVEVPLVLDAYSGLFLTPISTAPLAGEPFLVLDESGHAVKKMALFPGHLALAQDATLWHAYVIFDPVTLQAELATNAAPVNLLVADETAAEAMVGGPLSAAWMPKGGWPVIDDVEPPSGRTEPAKPGLSLTNAAQAKNRKASNLAPQEESTVILITPGSATGPSYSLDPESEAVAERDEPGTIILVPSGNQPLPQGLQSNAAKPKNRGGSNLVSAKAPVVIHVDPSAAIGATYSLDPESEAVAERDEPGFDTVGVLSFQVLPAMAGVPPGFGLAPVAASLSLGQADGAASVGGPLTEAPKERIGGTIILVPGIGYVPALFLPQQESTQTRAPRQVDNGN
ncbi:MAG: FG-GAP-like repeat-containing protein [Planctomycetota bacterium]|nr:FG-GAP-like repeat-containing protein [Planctomycetota bacterium]